MPTQSAQVIAKLLDLLPTCGAVNLTDSARAEIGTAYVAVLRQEEVAAPTMLNPWGETETPFGTVRVRRAGAGETGDGMRSQAMDESLLQGAALMPWAKRRHDDAVWGKSPCADEKTAGKCRACAAQKRARAQTGRHSAMDAGRSSG